MRGATSDAPRSPSSLPLRSRSIHLPPCACVQVVKNEFLSRLTLTDLWATERSRLNN